LQIRKSGGSVATLPFSALANHVRWLSPLGARGKGGKPAIVKIMTFVMPKDRYTYASACILPQVFSTCGDPSCFSIAFIPLAVPGVKWITNP